MSQQDTHTTIACLGSSTTAARGTFNWIAELKKRPFILRYSFDKIAQMNGWQFHIDGVHLNTGGGMILVDLVQEFLTHTTYDRFISC